MLNRKFILAFLIAISLPLVARAEMSEEDRQARCANNQARLAPLEMKYATYASDEEIARMRTAVSSIKHHFKTKYWPADDQVEAERLEHLGGSECMHERFPLACLVILQNTLEKRIDAAVRQIPERDALGREIANTRGRMTELRCNVVQPGPDTTDLSIASRFAQLRGRVSQDQYADAYGNLAVLLAKYGDQIGWMNAQDPSNPDDPGRGITNYTAHHDHVINHGGGDVAGSIANRVGELRQRLSPSSYAGMEREASQLLTRYGV